MALVMPIVACTLRSSASISEGQKAGASKSEATVCAFRVDDRERRYLVDLPHDLKAGDGLILVCHGFGDSPESIRDYSGFLDVIDRHQFVFAYLEGTRDREGKRNHQVEYAFQDPKIDDVKYARMVVDRLVRRYRLNRKHVFCTGMSNGADFSYYLARQPKPFVAAIAPIAGAMMACWDRHLTRQSRMSVMEVHGTADEVTLWAGDMANRDGWGAYLSVDALAKWWSGALGLKKVDRRDEGDVHLTRWWTDQDQSEYLLFTIPGGKHVWPANVGDPGKSLAEAIVEFFESKI